jgi:hypothetical protein
MTKIHAMEHDFWVAESSQVAEAAARDLLTWVNDSARIVAQSHPATVDAKLACYLFFEELVGLLPME